MPSTIVLVASVTLALALLWRFRRVGLRPKDFPPGPPCLPILGNLHQMPTHDSHKQFAAWAQEYGPIYSLILGTKTVIVLSDGQGVKDLLDRRSASYSDRMDMYVGTELCSGGLRLLLMRYGAQWRMLRRLVHQLLNVNVSASYVPYQDLENKQMLVEFLDDPDHFLEHIRRFTNSLTTSMVYGWRQTNSYSPAIAAIFASIEGFTTLTQRSVSAIVDFYPLLRRLPASLFPISAAAQRHHVREKELYRRLWLEAKHAVEAGTARPCFCVGMAAKQREAEAAAIAAVLAAEKGRPGSGAEAERISDDLAAYMAGTLLEAGSETTAATLYAFVQAMLLFPEAQARAQAELDAVIGPGRLPVLADAPALPAVRACVKEALRWMPTAPTGGVPHATTKEDTYRGFRIPKGAGIIFNTWGIHMDERRYANPREFRFERYLGDDMGAAESAGRGGWEQRDHYGFGAGRRICAGLHVAERSLFLGISRLLWGFSISAKSGTRPDPDALTQGFVAMPLPFEAKIMPRSPEHAEVMRGAWKEASEVLDPEGQWVREKVPVPKGGGGLWGNGEGDVGEGV
ncbi:uncharacterized protein K452DRAFT_272908 [Aplosporella prunicola CBS 121167]|uniref:Cytochrome P450 n=1 Tax=Aplosporella prunicola CBS 121167 TaxID=1176127 RepID=A0A6A6BF21_9PEZI|nr:uncharacterized protein K452DRAFT_272908 [Aplosporella prunicola CBS 121167]KAF2141081.1 hypothetical protein K452DRAFT_272908 [Aplosporella prunicola CBS 121167]